jgi:hypothetical protein
MRDHVEEEAVAGDVDREHARITVEATDGHVRERAYGHDPLIRGAAERGEIVVTDRRARLLGHELEGASRCQLGDTPRAADHERIPGAVDEQQVAVRLLPRRHPRREALIDVPRRADRDGVGQVLLCALHPRRERVVPGRIERDALISGVHARVGSARAAHLADLRIDRAQRAEQLAGDGAVVRLEREAVEAAALVRDAEQDAARQISPS